MSIQQTLFGGGEVVTVLRDAIGGTMTRSGVWQYHTFTSTDIFQFTLLTSNTGVSVLTVNGGQSGSTGFDADHASNGSDGGGGGPGGLYNITTGLNSNDFGFTARTVSVGGSDTASTFPLAASGNTAAGSGGSGGLGGSGSGGNANSGGAGVNLTTDWGITVSGGGGGGGGGAAEGFGGGSGGSGGSPGGGSGGSGGTFASSSVGDGSNGAANTGGGGGGGGGAYGDPNNYITGGNGGLGGSGIVIIKFQYRV